MPNIPLEVLSFTYHSRATRALDAIMSLLTAADAALHELVKEYDSSEILEAITEDKWVPDPDRRTNFVIERTRQKLEECVFAGLAVRK